MLSDFYSDFQSRVPKRVATDSQLSDMASDLRSVMIVNQSTVSDLYSLLSDMQSDFQSRVPKRVATDSQLSDAQSDIKSAIAGITASVSASDISDIASAVKLILASDMSDILSAAQQINSRVLVSKSTVSDIYSLLSDVQSDFQSRVPKRVATDSQLSDMASDLRSLIGVGAPLTASDMSDIRSAIAAVTVTVSASDISDIASAVKVILNSDLSDILSGVRRLTGAGALAVTITVKDGAVLLDGADVWITTDLAGTNIVARGYTNALGVIIFYLDVGTYYIWKQLSGYTFTNPESITVS
jgi:uncharacterized protein YeeX (DUF496 family)